MEDRQPRALRVRVEVVPHRDRLDQRGQEARSRALPSVHQVQARQGRRNQHAHHRGRDALLGAARAHHAVRGVPPERRRDQEQGRELEGLLLGEQLRPGR